MWTHYHTPATLDEALNLLQAHAGRARIIAGGTDLILELERGARPQVDTLIDVTRILGLSTISLVDGLFSLGPLVTHNHVVGDERLRQAALPLVQACWEVGAPQIRNRATLAGNVITASPANDTITALRALGAELTLTSTRGERHVALADFYTGYRANVLQADELLTALRFPALGAHQAGMFLKLSLRKAQAISVINAALVLTFAEENRHSPIQQARLTLGCVAPIIISLPEVEDYLKGKTLTDATIVEAAQLAARLPQPIDDVRGPAEYRREMIKVYVVRLLRAIRASEEAVHLPQRPAMLWGEHQGRPQTALAQGFQHERDRADSIETRVNGVAYKVAGGAHKTLLRFLREDLRLTGTKEGCAEGECGTCTVFLDGAAVMACMVPAPRAHHAELVTVEGLQASDGTLHPIQQGFMAAGAVQCGFCTPGFLMSGAKLLEENPQPSREQVEQSISGNLCRCTGYYRILEAFEKAAQTR
jgi:carbon-monoxide dehydrogenase medium subunit